MWQRRWRTLLRSVSEKLRRSHTRHTAGTRCQLEQLEDRSLLSISLVHDINPGPASSYPFWIANVKNQLFFTADDGEHGAELWGSDGTTEGTALVRDLTPGPTGSFPERMFNGNGTLYFLGGWRNPQYTQPMYASDGTAEGTVLLRAFRNVIGLIGPGGFTMVDDTLFFAAPNDPFPVHRPHQLFKSNGTPGGTVQVGFAAQGPSSLVNLNGTLVFTASSSEQGRELWQSDGTSVGTFVLKDINPGAGDSSPANLVNVNGTLFFRANDGINGEELWVSDGTKEGTYMLLDLVPGSAGSAPGNLVQVGDTLFFTAINAEGQVGLWTTDGTPEGTVLVRDFPTLSRSDFLGWTVVHDRVFFVTRDKPTSRQLWVSDGTKEGTVLLLDLRPETGSASLTNLTNFNGMLYFAANDQDVGDELWQSDGTPEGTYLVEDLLPGNQGSAPRELTVANDELYFAADDGNYGRELWRFTPDRTGGAPREARLPHAATPGWGADVAALVGTPHGNEKRQGANDEARMPEEMLTPGTPSLHLGHFFDRRPASFVIQEPNAPWPGARPARRAGNGELSVRLSRCDEEGVHLHGRYFAEDT